MAAAMEKFANRRRLVAALAGAFGSLVSVDHLLAQTTAAIPRVAIVLIGTMASESDTVQGYRETLRGLGYIDGQNVSLDFREVGGRSERLPALMADLLRDRPSVIVVAGSQAVSAARMATTAIPIVAQSIGDPVEQGYARSLARPAGNVTGNALIQEVTDEKTIELLRELLPQASRIAMLANHSHPIYARVNSRFQAAAAKLGASVAFLDASNGENLPRALDQLPALRVDALVVANDAFFHANRAVIVERVTRYRLPTVYSSHVYVVDGGLMSYSFNRAELVRNAARFVARILKGARPADLPFEQPRQFELAINLKAARALGLKVPQSLLLRADRVVE